MQILLSCFLAGFLIAGCGSGDSRSREGNLPGDDNAFESMIVEGIEPPVDSLTFAFYNVENLFDTRDDPSNRGDDEYTPSGKLRWTNERLERKLEDLARSIRAIGGYEGPDVLGVCEVENADVVERLAMEFLPESGYATVHIDSPDERGIDVALLYRKGAMTLVGSTLHRIELGGGDQTRGILEVGFQKDGRAFTVLVNHWPSRSGGEARSASKRIRAAETAVEIIERLTAKDPNADIILMGDLNDEPSDESVSDVLQALPFRKEFQGRMINTAAPVEERGTIGSYYFQGEWESIDQICLSRGALDSSGITLYQTSQTVFAPEFLRDAKANRNALPPYRTFKGPQYIAGTSDHFPVYLRVGWRKE